MKENKEITVKPTDIVTGHAERIQAMSGFNVDQIALIKSTVAKGTNDNELAYFLSVCKTVNLNPMLKQIWCYKDNRDNLLIVAGRDGFLTVAQRDTRWNGITSGYVCLNDKFDMDIPSGVVKHSPNIKDRGKILGAYAIARPHGCELATVEFADIDTYDKGQFVWKSHKGDMIMKVAEIHVLKKAYGISGLNSEYDFNIQNNVALPLDTASPENDLEQAQTKIIDGLDKYTGEDKEDLKQLCISKKQAGEFTMPFAKEIAKTIGVTL